ncbi:MAG TPA: hypothetical protein VG621_00295 [Candidatus Paceibacterota bacterium]|nr:hypothetical protein [Candidatus Paceibacterota bacterium]
MKKKLILVLSTYASFIFTNAQSPVNCTMDEWVLLNTHPNCISLDEARDLVKGVVDTIYQWENKMEIQKERQAGLTDEKFSKSYYVSLWPPLIQRVDMVRKIYLEKNTQHNKLPIWHYAITKGRSTVVKNTSLVIQWIIFCIIGLLVGLVIGVLSESEPRGFIMRAFLIALVVLSLMGMAFCETMAMPIFLSILAVIGLGMLSGYIILFTVSSVFLFIK